VAVKQLDLQEFINNDHHHDWRGKSAGNDNHHQQ